MYMQHSAPNQSYYYSYPYPYPTYYPTAQPVSHPANPAPRAPLGKLTNMVINTPETMASKPSSSLLPSKRKNPESQLQPSSSAKRARPSSSSTNSATTIPAAYGIGPHIPNTPAPKTFTYQEDTQNLASTHHALITDQKKNIAIADDVWHFIRALKSDKQPTQLPPKEEPLKERPSSKEFLYLGCRLCQFKQAWTVWKNVTGQTCTIRHHLQSKHFKLWRELVVVERLKGWDELSGAKVSDDTEPCMREPFTIRGFHERLARWIAADDQAINVVESPEWRELMLYVGNHLDASDLPHRTKTSQLIATSFQVEYDAMKLDIEAAPGRVSLTTDIWSRTSLEGYMGVTAHYIKEGLKQLELCSDLIAFRAIHGSHTGENIGKEMYEILKGLGVLNKLGMITTDNASNNSTAMSHIAWTLSDEGIPFDSFENHIRCFPHIINLAVKEVLKALVHPWAMPDDGFDIDTQEYWDALMSDLVPRVRKGVNKIRASGGRRKAFETLIKTVNNAGGFTKDPSKNVKEVLRVVGLLKDMDVRWSSTYKMIERFLELYQAYKKFIFDNPDFDDSYTFSDIEIMVLTDLSNLLLIFHAIQELVSAELTPTLSVVLPLYERLITLLTEFGQLKPQLTHAIDPAVAKLQAYLAETRKTKAYIMAMVLNPAIKFSWLKKHWPADDYNTARKTVFNVLLEFQRASHNSCPLHPANISETTASGTSPTSHTTPVGRHIVTIPPASKAACAQLSGMQKLRRLARSVSETLRAASEAGSSTDDSASQTMDEVASREKDDEAAVHAEMEAYESIPRMKEDDLVATDLLKYWHDNKRRYPLLFRACLDVLPIQASAVPSERVFSSSKETDTMRRANLGEITFERMQMLKYRVRKCRNGKSHDQLTFTERLVCSESELSVLDMDKDRVSSLYSSGDLDTLMSYIEESYRGWGRSE